MANKRKFAYIDRYEQEYIFNCLKEYPSWALNKLTPQELKIFKTDKSIKEFVNNATSDQKKMLLAKANIRHISLYIDMNKDEPLNFKNFNKLYKSFGVAKERKKVIDEIIDGNIFAVSSREVLNAGYLIAQNCHTPYFYINQNYKKVNNALEASVQRRIESGSAEDGDMKAMENYRDVCVNFFLAALQSEHFIKVAQKLDMMDIKILMHLFLHRETVLHKKVIIKLLVEYKTTYISNRLGRLLHSGYIDINRSVPHGTTGASNPSYVLAEMGYMVVNELIERIAQQAITL